jgi:hypothetical protein
MVDVAHAVEPVGPSVDEPYVEIDCLYWLVELPAIEGEIDVALWFINDNTKED